MKFASKQKQKQNACFAAYYTNAKMQFITKFTACLVVQRLTEETFVEERTLVVEEGLNIETEQL